MNFFLRYISHSFPNTSHYFQLNQSHLFRPTTFFVARCILLFQLHHQPSSLLFDVKKVEDRRFPSVFLSLYLYIFLWWSLLVLLVASPSQTNLASLILIYIVFFYQIFCTCRFRRGFIDIRRNIDRRLASFLCGKDRRGARLFQNISPKYLSIFPSMS